MPTIGVTTSPPAIADPIPMPIMTTTVMTPIAANRPAPPAIAQRALDSGVESSVSRRPPVSSEAQPLTSVATANPTRIRPNVTNASCRNAPAPLRSMFGKIVL